MHVRMGFVLPLLLVVTLFIPFTIRAQLLSDDRSVEIRVSPEYPSDNQTVTATLVATNIDLSTARIAWLINGKVVTDAKGTTYTFTTPALGESVSIGAFIEPVAQDAIATEITIQPTRVTLLWEGDTYTPAWYKGRSLYVAESDVRLHVIAEMVTPDGSYIDPSTLIYTWKRNGIHMKDISGIGRDTAIISGPRFFTSDIIEVIVRSTDGVYNGYSAIRISPEKPQLRVYLFDPLIGVINYTTADTLTSVNGGGDRSFLQVEPFYASVAHPNDPHIRYVWKLNDETVTALTDTPSRITLSSDIRSAVEVPLSITFAHHKHPLQQVQQTFSLFLEETGSGSFFGF